MSGPEGSGYLDPREALPDALIGVDGHQPAEPEGSELVALLSHELRSPLTSIRGYTAIMLRRWAQLADDEKQMMLGQISHDAARVTRLISELLDISRLESGGVALHPRPLALAALAQTVTTSLRVQYPDLDVSFRFPVGYPDAWADPDKVEQVVTNLMENACKYATAQGIVVYGDFDERDVWLGVVDRGEGMAPDDLRQVFTKSVRRPDGRPSGAGLGLWISRGLVEAHGGRLVASSVLGQGSTFCFSLPRGDRGGPTVA
jgi:signal transduction histidine kinase